MALVLICSTISRSWVAVIIVFPALAKSCSSSISHSWLRGSKPPVGSSNNSTSGLIDSIEAMHTFFFSPPLSVCGARSRKLEISIIEMTSSVRFLTSSLGRPSCSGPKAISSKTVEENSWTSGFWNTKPTFVRKY